MAGQSTPNFNVILNIIQLTKTTSIKRKSSRRNGNIQASSGRLIAAIVRQYDIYQFQLLSRSIEFNKKKRT